MLDDPPPSDLDTAPSEPPRVEPCPAPAEAAFVLPALSSLPTDELLEQVGDALKAARPGSLFSQGDRLVERHDRVGLAPVSVDRLSALIQQAVTVEVVAKDGAVSYRRVPRDCARWLRSAPAGHFSPIRGVRALPFLTSDLKIARIRGYYPDEQIWLDWAPSETLRDDASARRTLRSLIEAADADSRFGLVAALIEAVVRPACVGRVPVYVVTSTQGWAAARNVGRALSRFALGRPALDRGLPSHHRDLAAAAGSRVALDGPCVLMEGVGRGWSLVGGDLGRLLQGAGPVSLRRPGSPLPLQIDPRNTSWIASTSSRIPVAKAGEVPIRIHRLAPGLLDRFLVEQDAIVTLVVRATESWLAAGCPEPRGRVPCLSRWSEVVGGVLVHLLRDLDAGAPSEVESWLDGLGAVTPPPGQRWEKLFAAWPRDDAQAYQPLAASEIVRLAHESGSADLIPDAPPGSRQTEDAALGTALADLVEQAVEVGGLRLSRHRKRNGWAYAPVPAEQGAGGAGGAGGSLPVPGDD